MDDNNQSVEDKNQVEERMKNLVGAKKEAEAKAEAALKAQQEAESKVAQMEKETTFLNSFSEVSAKFPTASEFKDKIKEKVMTSGYSVDDATVAVLHAEGKLQSTAPQTGTVGGGSAPIQLTQSANKTVQEMNKAERWDALREAERRGDIGMR